MSRAGMRRRRNSISQADSLRDVLNIDPTDTVMTEDEKYIEEAKAAYNRLPASRKEEVLEAKREAQMWTATIGTLEVLIFLFLTAWTIAFCVFVGLNMYNTRLDYNTDYVGTSCSDKSNTVCQEVDLKRVRAVDIHWNFFAMFVALMLMYPIALGVTAMLKRSNLLIDHDAFTADEMNGTGFFGLCSGGGFLGMLTWPARFLSLQSVNHLSINYNIRHIIGDTIIFPIAFGMFGVRDLMKLIFIGVLAAAWNIWIHIAQLDNRRSWIATKLQEIVGGKPFVHRPASYWFAAIAQAVFGTFLWVVFLIYYVKFPYHSRQWYQSFVAIVLLITTGLRILFNLFRWVCQDVRTSQVIVSGAGLVANVMYAGSQIGIMFGSVFCKYPFAIQMFLTVWDGLYFFLPWILLIGLDGHANIARIRFPTDVILTY